MAIYTFSELDEKTISLIQMIINAGYRINSRKSVSVNPNKCVAAFNNKIGSECEIIMLTDNDTYECEFRINGVHIFSVKYYKSHDNIYADSKQEADKEHKRWIMFNLGIPY